MKKVALIEDDKILSDSLSSALQEAGIEVTRAFDGEEGLRLVQTEKPDLVLLDIMLPKLDGLAVAKQLNSDPLTTGIPVIILTVLEKAAPVADAIESGVFEYIIKSELTVAEIVKRVQEKLASPPGNS